jgi:hypothetical protein
MGPPRVGGPVALKRYFFRVFASFSFSRYSVSIASRGDIRRD